MTSRYTTSGKRFIGPRVDPVTGESVFPLRRLPVIREGDTLATLHHPDGRREVVHPSAYADLECRVRAAGMQ